MSIRTLTRVWESSRHAGTDLLMLLAIADFADDDGAAYPSVEKLARKCRMKPRNCQYILRVLTDSGELEIHQNQGPKGTNLYQVNLAALGVQQSAWVQGSAGVQQSARRGAKLCAKPLQPIAPEPSVNRQEPSTQPARRKNPRRASSPSASDFVTDGFSDFWERYPRKEDKTKAQKVWSRMKPKGQLLADVMAGLQRARASEQWQKDGGKYIPYPATWLNGRRWEDEIQSPGDTAVLPINPIFAGAR